MLLRLLLSEGRLRGSLILCFANTCEILLLLSKGCYFQWGHIFWNFVVNLSVSLNSLAQTPTKVNYFSSPMRV